MSNQEPPVLDAYRTGRPGRQQLEVWCQYERRWHAHGTAGSEFGSGDGHRIAHCAVDTPYHRFDGLFPGTGYILREVPGPRPNMNKATPS